MAASQVDRAGNAENAEKKGWGYMRHAGLTSRLLLTLLVVLSAGSVSGQSLRFSGNARDSSGGQPLPNVLLMAMKFSDSTLAGFSRSDLSGSFKPFVAPRDTYIVIMAHPSYSDRTYLLVPSETDTAYRFTNVVLPPKSVTLNEVEIIAYRDKSYYKGDTLVFTADSFKTAANATVEDLLKKLPGFRVDQAGKITVQGKQVDQVLVDGDEFFGTDPTVATRNLNAASIQNVQVYEKKNENNAEGSEETLKVVNLQMKEDAKKGYFGKVSGAGDFRDYYEAEALGNYFKGSRKISVFGMGANTPRRAFSYSDINQYGLSGEQSWAYDEETDSWSSNRNDMKGIPRTIRSGFYFNDKFGATKVNADYTFSQTRLQSGMETNTQYFLEDTTFTNFRVNSNNSGSDNHSFNFRVVSKLDSLTELTVAPKVRRNTSDTRTSQTDEFISADNVYTRQTVISNNSASENSDLNCAIRLNRNFRKKERSLTLNYQPVHNESATNATLNTVFDYFTGTEPDSSFLQRRTQEGFSTSHNAGISYTEPFTNKFKTEISYNVSGNRNGSNRQTFDLLSPGNDRLNTTLSNRFDNTRLTQRAGAKLIYEVNKYRLSVGAQFRNVTQRNNDLSNDRILSQSVDNILPNANFRYKFNQGSQLSLHYNSNSQLPDLLQMQPVPDNSDPNRVTIGNPDLKPTFAHNGSLNYYFYKGVSDVVFWSGFNLGSVNNQISSSTYIDEFGRSVTQAINVNGNYYGNVWLGGGFPVFSRFMKVNPRFNSSHNNSVSYVNGTRNVSTNTSYGPSIVLQKETKDYEVYLTGNYDYNVPRSSLSRSSQQPYYTYGIEASVMVKLPGKFTVHTDGSYVNNGNRTPGYNLNYFILNASVEKAFLKSEGLLLSVIGNDLLSQNISNERFITANQIVDRKVQVIQRYFLLKLMYKFNNQKKKSGEDDDD